MLRYKSPLKNNFQIESESFSNMLSIPLPKHASFSRIAKAQTKSHGWRGLMGCSPWGHQESDTTERLHFHFSFSCIGEGNGNALQCSFLENPRDGGAWWAAVYGVAQSRTRLKQLSSSSSSKQKVFFSQYSKVHITSNFHLLSTVTETTEKK